jgi:Spy/CpxP family protein refolding chaperone
MKASLLALVLLCAAGTAVAQTPTTPPPPGQHGGAQQLERLATLLDLTVEQKTQVKTILDAEHAKMKAQFDQAQASGTRPTSEQMRAAREQLKADTAQQLTPVLTPAQLKKFQVLMAEEPGGPHGFGPHGPPPGDAPPNSQN